MVFIFSDNVVDFRFKEKFENHKVSIMSKSKILCIRLAGIISLLRNSMKDPEEVDRVITKDDFIMATSLVKYSVATSFKLLTKFDGSKEKKTQENSGYEIENAGARCPVFHFRVRTNSK